MEVLRWRRRFATEALPAPPCGGSPGDYTDPACPIAAFQRRRGAALSPLARPASSPPIHRLALQARPLPLQPREVWNVQHTRQDPRGARRNRRVIQETGVEMPHRAALAGLPPWIPALFEIHSDALVGLDEAGRVCFVNRAAARLAGREPE